jgi:hypothetical protein
MPGEKTINKKAVKRDCTKLLSNIFILKKNPRIENNSIRGFPIFILKILWGTSVRGGYFLDSGRYSDFPALLATFPSRFTGTVVHKG